MGIYIGTTAYWYLSKLNTKKPESHSVIKSRIKERLTLHADIAKQFANKYQFNNEVCFLVDMSMESGKKRLFVFNLSTDSVLEAGMVTHGRCNESWLVGRKYSNEIGFGCTSLGKYKIRYPYKGRFGLAYKLTGLDTTNSNAFKRFVVLHAHECVPEEEVHPYPICQSDGCPTVSKEFLKKLAAIIDASPKPILLWIYD